MRKKNNYISLAGLNTMISGAKLLNIKQFEKELLKFFSRNDTRGIIVNII